MELRDLEYFVVVAEKGNLGRAADALRLSQPALSKSLARLETALGVKLLKRNPRGVEMTPEGAVLFSRSRELRQMLRNISTEVSDISNGLSAHLRIGVGPSVDDRFVMAALGELIAQSPRLTMEVILSDGDVIEASLRAGQLDVIVNMQPLREPEGLTNTRLYIEEYVVCCAAEHPRAREANIPLAGLVAERWAMSNVGLASQQRLHDVFRLNGLPPPPLAFESRSLDFRLKVVACSDLLVFVPRRMAERAIESGVSLRILVVPGLDWRPGVSAMRRKESYVHPAVLRLVDVLERRAATMTARDPSIAR